MGAKFGEWLVLIGYCSIIFVLVRPGSQGPALVESIGNSISAITNAATGGAEWNAGGGGN